MKNYIDNNLNFKILGKRNILIFLIAIVVFIAINFFSRPSLKTVYEYTDILFPIVFSLIGLYLFHVDCISNLNDVILVYNKKKYNKILLKRILDYILLVVAVILILTFFLYYNIDQGSIFMEMPRNAFMLFLRTIPNTLFLTAILLFLLKITKNIMASAIVFVIGLFQEFVGLGTYTYPFNLFINSTSRNRFTESLFLMNRVTLTVVAVLLIWYIVKKKNN
ncbi:MAG: hypothetical protein ACRDD2_10450 [Sarcina sp.]